MRLFHPSSVFYRGFWAVATISTNHCRMVGITGGGRPLVALFVEPPKFFHDSGGFAATSLPLRRVGVRDNVVFRGSFAAPL